MADFAHNSATFGVGAFDDVRTKLPPLDWGNSLHVHTGLHVRVGNQSASSHEIKGVRIVMSRPPANGCQVPALAVPAGVSGPKGTEDLCGYLRASLSF